MCQSCMLLVSVYCIELSSSSFKLIHHEDFIWYCSLTTLYAKMKILTVISRIIVFPICKFLIYLVLLWSRLFLWKNMHGTQSVVQCSIWFTLHCIMNHFIIYSVVLYLCTEVTGCVCAYECCLLWHIQLCNWIPNIASIVLKVCCAEILLLLSYS